MHLCLCADSLFGIASSCTVFLRREQSTTLTYEREGTDYVNSGAGVVRAAFESRYIADQAYASGPRIQLLQWAMSGRGKSYFLCVIVGACNCSSSRLFSNLNPRHRIGDRLLEPAAQRPLLPKAQEGTDENV